MSTKQVIVSSDGSVSQYCNYAPNGPCEPHGLSVTADGRIEQYQEGTRFKAEPKWLRPSDEVTTTMSRFARAAIEDRRDDCERILTSLAPKWTDYSDTAPYPEALVMAAVLLVMERSTAAFEALRRRYLNRWDAARRETKKPYADEPWTDTPWAREAHDIIDKHAAGLHMAISALASKHSETPPNAEPNGEGVD